MLHDSDGEPTLPYRGRFGARRPPRLAALALPPAAMPARQGRRPLKAWRYVGVFGPELMLCVATVRIGPARQAFWAVWDRQAQRLYERTRPGRGRVALATGRIRVNDGPVQIALDLTEGPGVEAICPSGAAYGWTRKQGDVPTEGIVTLDGRRHELRARAVIDDTAAYYERHTRWRWSAGVGTTPQGADVAWNLVSGVNDPPAASERSVWLDGVVSEPQPVSFSEDLSAVGQLRFCAEATRERRENRLLVRSHYRQPFGTFSGSLAPGVQLAEGYGVMEAHDVWW
ncbi:MAG TPA: DUF2804 family protein [Solirubrobacteraceae bacterium]|nr:DUF2804 family protein [Solirubrobacteraceae bacterium]